MKFRYIILVCFIIALVGYTLGRYIQPPSIKIEKEIVEVVKEVEVVKTEVIKEELKKTKTIIKEYPDGTKITEIYEVTEDTIFIEKNEETKVDTEISEDTSNIVENQRPQWKVNIGVIPENLHKYNYEVSVSKRFMGPIFLGASYNTKNEIGIHAGLEF